MVGAAAVDAVVVVVETGFLHAGQVLAAAVAGLVHPTHATRRRTSSDTCKQGCLRSGLGLSCTL